MSSPYIPTGGICEMLEDVFNDTRHLFTNAMSDFVVVDNCNGQFGDRSASEACLGGLFSFACSTNR